MEKLVVTGFWSAFPSSFCLCYKETFFFLNLSEGNYEEKVNVSTRDRWETRRTWTSYGIHYPPSCLGVRQVLPVIPGPAFQFFHPVMCYPQHHHHQKNAFKITLDYSTYYIWLKDEKFRENLKVYFFFPLLTRVY